MRWLRSLFAWRQVADSGVWAYFENTLTGRRKAIRVGGGWQPLSDFIRPGDVVVGPRGAQTVGSMPTHPPGR